MTHTPAPAETFLLLSHPLAAPRNITIHSQHENDALAMRAAKIENEAEGRRSTRRSVVWYVHSLTNVREALNGSYDFTLVANVPGVDVGVSA